jgi:hypothetical protein
MVSERNLPPINLCSPTRGAISDIRTNQSLSFGAIERVLFSSGWLEHWRCPALLLRLIRRDIMKITRACKCILNFAELYHVSLTRWFGSSKANHVVCMMKSPWIICELVLATLCKELAPSFGVDWRFDCPTERVPSRFQMQSHLSVCFTCRSTQLSNEDPMTMQLLSIAVNATSSLTSCWRSCLLQVIRNRNRLHCFFAKAQVFINHLLDHRMVSAMIRGYNVFTNTTFQTPCAIFALCGTFAAQEYIL